MKDNNVPIDRKKHLLYSKSAKHVMQTCLHEAFPAQENRLWEDIQIKFAQIVEDMPYMGGKKNIQSQSVYDCAALFAYYLTVPVKPTLAEFEDMNNRLFVSAMKRHGAVNLNNPLLMKAANWLYQHLAKQNARHRTDWEGNYIMDTEPVQEGTKYVFRRCPIAELAKRLGLTHLMPAMCNPDYPMLHILHADLIRTATCGFADRCDFHIVGDESALLAQYEKIKNKDGYWYSRKK